MGAGSVQMPRAHGHPRAHVAALAAGASLTAAVVAASVVAGGLIGHVSRTAHHGSATAGTVRLATAERTHKRVARHHSHFKPAVPHRAARTPSRHSTPVRATAPRAAMHIRKTHRTRSAPRRAVATIAPSAPVTAAAPSPTAPKPVTVPPSPANGRRVGQLRKASRPAAPTAMATRSHGNPHSNAGHVPPGWAHRSQPHGPAVASPVVTPTRAHGAGHGRGHNR